MEPVLFELAPSNTPEGEYRVLAKDQPQYLPLPCFRTPEGRVVTAWQPSPEELVALNRGELIYLQVATFNHKFHPVKLTVGEPELMARATVCPVVD